MRQESSERHNVIILPGLSDGVRNIEIATNWWKSQGLIPHPFYVGWRDDSKFRPKLDMIVRLASDLSKEGRVSIVGASAGGSAALNVFFERPDIIQRAVSVCGRLRAGQHTGWRSLETRSATSKSFRHSILLLEGRENDIPKVLLPRIMTVTARFGDELVPADTSTLPGAHNITVPVGEHVFSIGMSLTLLARPIIEFLNSEKVE